MRRDRYSADEESFMKRKVEEYDELKEELKKR